jgi:hypothetical protein
LICENIDDRYRRLLQTHNVGLLTFDRAAFIDIAIRCCPEVVQRFLVSDDSRISEPEEDRGSADDSKKIRFQPLRWYSHLSPHDVLRHLHEEFGRLGLDIEKIPREWYRQIYYDAWHFLERGTKSTIETLLVPSSWKFDKLYERGNSVRATHLNDWNRIAKPRIHLFAEVTIKNNLRAFWYPNEFETSFGRAEDSDWLNWCGDASYGWSRPHNELLFVRDVGHLHPGFDDSMNWDDRVNWDVLDEIFVALIYSCYAYLIEILSSCLDVHIHTGIEIETRERPDRNNGQMGGDRICGWSLFSYAGSRARIGESVVEYIRKTIWRISKGAIGSLQRWREEAKSDSRELCALC